MAKSVVLIDGNICSGKTTLVNYIRDHQHRFNEFLSKEETFKQFVEFIDPSWLQLFYQDRKKYSSWFEKSCLIARIGRHFVAKDHKGIVFFDRGMLGGAHTFCRNSFDDGYLRYDQWHEYKQMLRSGFDDLDRSDQKRWLEQLVVYLRVEDIETLKKRNEVRNTKGEKVPLDYLLRINRLYEDFFYNIEEEYRNYGLKAPKVLTIDASVEFLSNDNYMMEILDQVIDNLRRLA